MSVREPIRAITIVLIAGLAFAALPARAPAWAQEPAQDAAGERYVHPSFGWSVSIPEHWTYVAARTSVMIRTPDGLPPGLIGIHTVNIPGKTLEEFVDELEEFTKRNLEARGRKVVTVSRKKLMLADGLPAIEIVKEMGSGVIGISLRVTAMFDGKAVTIDAETYKQSWDELRPHFDAIVKSFSPAQ